MDVVEHEPASHCFDVCRDYRVTPRSFAFWEGDTVEFSNVMERSWEEEQLRLDEVELEVAG